MNHTADMLGSHRFFCLLTESGSGRVLFKMTDHLGFKRAFSGLMFFSQRMSEEKQTTDRVGPLRMNWADI